MKFEKIEDDAEYFTEWQAMSNGRKYSIVKDHQNPYGYTALVDGCELAVTRFENFQQCRAWCIKFDKSNLASVIL